jgi:hypothetical protein
MRDRACAIGSTRVTASLGRGSQHRARDRMHRLSLPRRHVDACELRSVASTATVHDGDVDAIGRPTALGVQKAASRSRDIRDEAPSRQAPGRPERPRTSKDRFVTSTEGHESAAALNVHRSPSFPTQRPHVPMTAGNAGATVLREGRQPLRGETSAWVEGSTRSATARPRKARTRPCQSTDMPLRQISALVSATGLAGESTSARL